MLSMAKSKLGAGIEMGGLNSISPTNPNKEYRTRKRKRMAESGQSGACVHIAAVPFSLAENEGLGLISSEFEGRS